MNGAAPIRLALVLRPAAGGMKTHIETLLTFLNRERFAPTLIAGAEFVALAQRMNTPHIPFDIPPKTSIRADARAVRELKMALAGNFDLVHGHGVRGLWIGAFAAERAGLPFVATAHNLLPKPSFVQSVGISLALRYTKRLIAVSNAVLESFRDCNLDLPPVNVIPNGIDLSRYDAPGNPAALRKQYQIPDAAPVIAAVGRLEKEKGFDQLILSFGFLRSEEKEARLIIAGEGGEQENLSDMASSDMQIHLAGRVADPTPYYQLADVVAIPSRSEGQGIVALEAMAAGKPVVAYRVGGLSETLEDNVTGYLVKPSDVLEFAQALALLLKSPDLRRSMGEAGRARVASQYAAQKAAQQIESVYLQTLNDNANGI